MGLTAFFRISSLNLEANQAQLLRLEGGLQTPTAWAQADSGTPFTLGLSPRDEDQKLLIGHIDGPAGFWMGRVETLSHQRV